MPALQEARDFIKTMNDANVEVLGKGRLLYVNKLRHRKVKNTKQTWMLRRPDHGLSPIVSPMQNSPAIKGGGYIQLEAGAIVTRHIKRFSEDELRNLASPDANYRIDAKYHLGKEMEDSDRRIWDTMEFIAHSAIARGSFRYILNDSVSRVDVNLTFPVKTKTVAASWHLIGTDIPAQVDVYLKEFKNRYGKLPDLMRMTTETWEYVKNNTAVKATFSTYLRTAGATPGDILRGVITPAFVVKALDWPPIEIYDERTHVQYSRPSDAATVTGDGSTAQAISLSGGTFGISIGDTLLCQYAVNSSNGYEDWAHEAVVTAVNPGVSVTAVIANGETIAASEVITVKPTFFPQQKVLMIADEAANNEFILPPFGLEYSGSNISLANWYGPRKDVFSVGNEPGLAAARRNWHEFGLGMHNPNAQMSIQIKI